MADAADDPSAAEPCSGWGNAAMEHGERQPGEAGAEVAVRRPGDGPAHLAGGQTTRDRQALRGLWSWTFGAGTWRAAIYGLLSLPVGVACLLLGLAGAHGVAARMQAGLAGCWLHRPVERPRGGYRWGRVVSLALLTAMIGLLCWLLVALAGPNTVRNVLLYPLTDGSTAARSWGGPTLAGAWAVHAALALVLLPLELWVLRGLTGLQGRLVARLAGADRTWWVLPVAILVAALGLLMLRGFISQL
jgi:hypothetical protein